jgi:hypothetical protein
MVLLRFTLIEWKESLDRLGYLGYFVFLPKLFDASHCNLIQENLRDCCYGHINSNRIGLN